MPEILCGGHDLQREAKPPVYQRFANKARQLTELFEALLPGEANLGLEPSWTQIYPYQSLAEPGDTVEVQVRIINFAERPMPAEVALVLPEGWVASPMAGHLDLAPRQRGVATFRVHVPEAYVFRYPRVAIAADVALDGRHIGQVAEATVEYQATAHPAGR
jgi:hypothetical protein